MVGGSFSSMAIRRFPTNAFMTRGGTSGMAGDSSTAPLAERRARAREFDLIDSPGREERIGSLAVVFFSTGPPAAPRPLIFRSSTAPASPTFEGRRRAARDDERSA